MNEYTINFSWDDEAGVWIAICDDIPLALESNSFDALIEKVKVVVPEILALNKKPSYTSLSIHSERLIANG
jgi:hypothetical protein